MSNGYSATCHHRYWSLRKATYESITLLKSAFCDAVSASDAGAFSDVWGKYVVVAYTELGSQAEMGRPSFGYTYQLGGYPMVSPARYDGDTRTWLYDVADAVQPVIAADLAGYLISAAVA